MKVYVMTDPGLIRQYLLGAASEQERIAFENEYLANQEVFETLVAAENDLIDSYSRGALSDFETSQFEKRYLTSSRGRARVEFSRLLAEVSKEARPTQSVRPPIFWERALAHCRQYRLQWGLAAACATVLIIAIGFFGVPHKPDLKAASKVPGRDGQQIPPKAGQQHAETVNQADNEPTQIASASPTEFTLRLDGGSSRTVGSALDNTVSLPAKSSWLNLELKVDDRGGKSYVAELEAPDGTRLQRTAELKSDLISGQSIVQLRFPSQTVPAGDYVIELKISSGEVVNSYSFRVLNK